MEKLLITRKGKKPVPLIIVSIFLMLLGIITIAAGGLESNWRESEFEEICRIAAPFLTMFLGLAILASTLGIHGKTYISVFSGHIEGVGIIGGKAQSFYFRKDQNYSVSVMGSRITVFCNGAGYTVMLSQPDAQQVYRCATFGTPADGGQSGGFGGGQSSGFGGGQSGGTPNVNPGGNDPERIFVFCPNCGTKCRVPRNKGKLLVVCPKCSKDFTVNT